MSAKLNRQRGKRAERRVAELVGGRRVGVLGGEDIMHDAFSIEVKSRKKFVAQRWMEQAEKNAQGKMAVVVVHIHKEKYEDAFVIVRLKDFLRLSQKAFASS
ncbi:MAG: hypothetical protein P3W91_000765 [Fervidobacterium sp.]|nr:hypothetical protein [Fervidobacterium sp.]